MTTLEILREGRRRIAEVGWCQGTLVKFMLPRIGVGTPIAFCVMGAVKFLQSELGDVAVAELWSTLRGQGGEFQPGLPEWNDACGRTVEDVLKLYDDTIARLEQAAQP